jgi:hypothetical protein
MKLCKDCKHYDLPTDKCQHPKTADIHPVHGGPEYMFAYSSRRLGKCGMDAKHFEPKEDKP